jgi:hypothetical protein
MGLGAPRGSDFMRYGAAIAQLYRDGAALS